MANGCSSALDHPHAHFRLHVGVQANRNAIDAERLDRLVQVDLALLDVEALRLELRAMSAAVTEPNSLPSSPTRAEKVSETCSSFSPAPAPSPTLVLGGLEAGALLLDALHVARRRLVGEAVGEEKVAGEARSTFTMSPVGRACRPLVAE